MIRAETIEQIETMLRSRDYSHRAIAHICGVCHATVDAVANRRITSASERRREKPKPKPRGRPKGSRVWRAECGHLITTKTCIECEMNRQKSVRREVAGAIA